MEIGEINQNITHMYKKSVTCNEREGQVSAELEEYVIIRNL